MNQNTFWKKGLISLISITLIIPFLVHGLYTSWHYHVFEYLIFLSVYFTGFLFLRLTLIRFFTWIVSDLVILFLSTGTNLFYMASVEFNVQSVLLFTLYTGLVYFTLRWHFNPKIYQMVALALFTAMIFLVQATGYIAVMIPVLWNISGKETLHEKLETLKKHKKQLMIFAGCLIFFILPPLLILKMVPGEMKIIGIKLPGLFIVGSRYFWNDLFSFDHGWFIYTPLILLPAVGFYFLADRKPGLLFSLFLFCIADLVLETCWTVPLDSNIFSQRLFTQLYAVIALPAGFGLAWILERKIPVRIILLLICGLFVLLNLFQSWQYKTGRIFSDPMTAKSYFAVFARTRLTEDEKQSLPGYAEDAAALLSEESKFNRSTLAYFDFENAAVSYKRALETKFAKNGHYGLRMDSTVRFSPGIKMPYSSLIRDSWIGVRFTASVFSKHPIPNSTAFLVITSVHDGICYRYKTLDAGTTHLAPGQWNTITMNYISPADPLPDDILQAYVWYKGNSELFIDDVKFELFERKK